MNVRVTSPDIGRRDEGREFHDPRGSRDKIRKLGQIMRLREPSRQTDLQGFQREFARLLTIEGGSVRKPEVEICLCDPEVSFRAPVPFVRTGLGRPRHKEQNEGACT